MSEPLAGKRVDIHLPDGSTRSMFIYEMSTTRDVCQQ